VKAKLPVVLSNSFLDFSQTINLARRKLGTEHAQGVKTQLLQAEDIKDPFDQVDVEALPA
jgi:hypothetical protein